MTPGSREAAPPKAVLAFWAPLAATWLMMAVEGPYVAAIIARLSNATVNLAAYGVAFSFAFIAEAPIIMMMTAANALVRGRRSLLSLRRFLFLLNGLLTLVMATLALPPVFRFITEDLMGLPSELVRLANVSTAFLVLWPAAIGYRRFYQGILVRHKMPRRVAYGTVVRLVTMSVGAAGLALATPLPGACVGALALALGVIAEAAASRFMARHLVTGIMSTDDPETDPGMSVREIAGFYVPLALTSLLPIVVNPSVTFFLGRSRAPVESLAVMPVVTSFVFIFRSGALAYQEVCVALVGANPENERPVVRVATSLAAAAAAAQALVVFTPLGFLWFGGLSGLSDTLAAFALWPARVLALLPPLDYLMNFQRALLVLGRRTRMITGATAVEASALLVMLVVGVSTLRWFGALAAATAILTGRLASNVFLWTAVRRMRASTVPTES